MKCPKCGFFVPDRLNSCRKCGKDLAAEKAKLGLAFFNLETSRFDKTGSLSAHSEPVAPGGSGWVEPRDPVSADSLDSAGEAPGGNESDEEPNLRSGGGTEELEKPEEFCHSDFGEDLGTLDTISEVDEEMTFAVGGSDDSLETFGFPLAAEEDSANSDSSDAFGDIGEMETSELQEEEAFLDRTDGSLGVRGSADSEVLVHEPGEPKDIINTVRLDPTEIENILQSEFPLETEGEHVSHSKKTMLLDDDELSQILDEVDKVAKSSPEDTNP